MMIILYRMLVIYALKLVQKIFRIVYVGFDFKNSPLGIDSFDYAHGKNNVQFKYQDIFTGMVFYLPLSEHKLSSGIPGLVPSCFKKEFLRRIKICEGDKLYEQLKNDSILYGWNKEKYHDYDKLNEKVKTIEHLKEQYLKVTK